MPAHLADRLISWASILEPDTRDQARRTASMPFVFPHLALMPDAHLGKGATVGSVIPTAKAIIPAAVGVDIGCGMIALRTQFDASDFAARDLSALRVAIENAIPLSAGKHNTALTETAAARCVEAWIGEPIVACERVNCHHNFTQRETHFGTSVWVSRKGAIEADAGRPGLIPGSMGSASYVVEGKGNALALNSAPHGAGRAFSRSAARRRFSIEDLRASMKGIEYRDTDAFIDEIPAAYKDIDQVMSDAAEMVEIRHTLRQIVNVKGD